MDGSSSHINADSIVRTLFQNIKNRRNGIIKALTKDYSQFYKECDPGKENLSLFGLENGSWRISDPGEDTPPSEPEPVVGINFAKDGLKKQDWLRFIAYHSEAWLYSLAYFHAICLHLDTKKKAHLFNRINSLPSLAGVVAEYWDRSGADPGSSSKESGKPRKRGKEVKGGDADNCGACQTSRGGFWVQCNFCDKWFHTDCVQIDVETAEKIEAYKCPFCSKKGAV